MEVEPENEEYAEMLSSLKEVIELTQDLIKDQQQETKPSRSRWGLAQTPVRSPRGFKWTGIEMRQGQSPLLGG